jgi:O-antigen/teichoic acid export membrane protein
MVCAGWFGGFDVSVNVGTDRPDGPLGHLLSRHPVPCGIAVGLVCFLALPISLYAAAPIDGSTSSWPWLLPAAFYAAVFAVGVALFTMKGRWRRLGVALVVGATVGVLLALTVVAYLLALSSVGD